MDAFETVKRTIEEKHLIEEGCGVLLGLSGGPDSLCLLHILWKLQEPLGFRLYALHVNHMIRGEAANEDMRWVANYCRAFNVPLTIKVCNVPAMAKRDGVGEEAEGRRVRHAALEKRAREIAQTLPEGTKVHVALAHNRDDQAETVLMRILRGTGVHGLAAMDHAREDGLIRPLLDVPRKDVEEYCRVNRLRPRVDETNKDLRYTRNRLRYRLMPVLEREFNPSLPDALARLADSAREDDRCLSAIAKENVPLPAAFVEQKQLASMDPAIAKRVIRQMFFEAGLREDISYVHLNALLDAAKRSERALIQFPKGYSADVSYGRVTFLPPAAGGEKASYVATYLLIPAEEAPPFAELGPDRCLMDAEKVAEKDCDVVLRTRRSGDWIKPLGMEGTKKLQDMLVDSKIPRADRDGLQLLCCGAEVLWIQGGKLSRTCRLDESSRFALLLEIHRVSD